MIDKRYKTIRSIYLIVTILLFLFWIIGSIQAFLNGNNPIYYVFYYIFMACILAGCIYYLSIPLGARVVYGKLSYQELSDLINKESLKKVNITSLKKGYLASDLYTSKHWIYAGEAYIPKSMIYYLCAQKKKNYSIIYIVTTNGKEIRIADIDNDSIKTFLKFLKKTCPECTCTEKELYENYGKPKFKIPKKEWKKMSKEKFIELILEK